MSNNLHSCISIIKNPDDIPDYANIIENYDEIWNEEKGARYPIFWKLGFKKLFSSTQFNKNDQVNFFYKDFYGGLIRKFTNISKNDEIGNAYSAVYCKFTNELLIFSLFAKEARFGGIVIVPNEVTK